MNKQEIIESLYKEGKITFQEAMTLSANEGPQATGVPTLTEGAQSDQEKIWEQERHKTEIIEEFLNEITDECYDDKDDPDHKVNLAFDIDKCVKAMDVNNWTWATGNLTPDGSLEMEYVSHNLFRKDLRQYIRNVINLVNKKRKENDPEERKNGFESFYGTGGIEVTGWIEEEEDGKERLVISPRFVLESVEIDLAPDKFAELLK